MDNNRTTDPLQALRVLQNQGDIMEFQGPPLELIALMVALEYGTYCAIAFGVIYFAVRKAIRDAKT